MKIEETKLPGVMIIEPKVFGDSRGYFYESFQAKRYAEHGITLPFVQDNASRSTKNVLRGLHHQKEHTQGKLIYVTSGAVFDVAVDIRVGSPTFGQWVGTVLDDTNHRQLYIPPGFAHGFCVLSNNSDFFYKCTDFYDPVSEITVQWNDPDIGIKWPVTNPALSAKDAKGKLLKDFTQDELPQYEK